MIINEIFYSDKYDNIKFVKNKDKLYSVLEIKKLILAKSRELSKKNENIFIINDNNFSFIINFFACLFAHKNIYLADSVKRIESAKFSYDVADDNLLFLDEYPYFDKIDFSIGNINFYTSGSTSEPKIIKKSLNNLMFEAEDIKSELSLQENVTVSLTTVMQYLFGLTFGLMFPIANINKGFIIDTNKILYPDNLDIKNLMLVSTPSFLDKIEKYNVQFIEKPKYIFSAGSKLDSKTFSYLEKYSSVVEIYGSSETGVIAYKRRSTDEFNIFKNVRINSTNNKTVITSNYSFENTVEINDEIEIVANKLIFKKRKDRLLKIADKRINALEIQEEINKNNFISESYCFKSDSSFAILCALTNQGKDYIVKNGVLKTKNELKKYLSKKIEFIPKKWKFIDEIPKNIRGKIDKEIIEKLFNINFSFPVILDKKVLSNEIIYKLFLYKNSDYFNGHFPEFEITPGVVQLYIAGFLAKYNFGGDILSGQIKKIKFTNIIKADSIINLKLTKSDKNVNFEYFDDNDTIFSSGVFPISNVFELAELNEIK